MKYWFRLFLLIACVLGVITMVGRFLPHGYSFVATTEILASPEEVYALIDETPKWKQWSQWDPDSIAELEVEYSADNKAQTWKDVRGNGKLWFVEQTQNEEVRYRLVYGDFPEMEAAIRLTPTPAGTEVSWSSSGQLPSGAFYGFFRSVFTVGMQQQYEQSLQKLKTIAEK